MFATVHNNIDLTYLLGVIIVIGCLIAAGVSAFRAAWVAALCLVGVAIVAAYLLL